MFMVGYLNGFLNNPAPAEDSSHPAEALSVEFANTGLLKCSGDAQLQPDVFLQTLLER